MGGTRGFGGGTAEGRRAGAAREGRGGAGLEAGHELPDGGADTRQLVPWHDGVCHRASHGLHAATRDVAVAAGAAAGASGGARTENKVRAEAAYTIKMKGRPVAYAAEFHVDEHVVRAQRPALGKRLTLDSRMLPNIAKYIAKYNSSSV